ncbi:hypothetical protein AXG93_815s1020 [Marchantia polymorpha subsp. ruderalis]|uniref:Protein kinase domain-containing protein n=1 Tax=Marchantia polymorpha subsp. ruderalis TaxID=1480154 RepID=A0A176W1K6_MARPO|nr:hypothetical protein AXG93_815s1020 [Marchantia polymorpha subsp. ruderalis]
MARALRWLALALSWLGLLGLAQGLGTAGKIAVSYGVNGQALCQIKEDGSQLTTCFGTDAASVSGAPSRHALSGITGGDGSIKYVGISAGDNHLCALREGGASVNAEARKKSANASSSLGPNRTAICWGDDSGYNVIQGVPDVAFSSIAAGGYHGVFLNGLVGGKFHSCGLKADTLTPICWGLATPSLVPTPENESLQFMVAGDYFTCGVSGGSLRTVCWGSNYPLPSVAPPVPIIIGELVTAVVAPSNNTPPTTAPTTDASLPHHHQHHHAKKSSFRSSSNKTKGGFSIVYKGILASGTVVAVKRAMGSTTNPDKVPESKEFRNELDLLSRLNHAHLLNLLGYCEEGGERLLVYEYMANGTLFEHLHGEDKEQLNWWNARVADFGLSLFGPENSNCPLSEPPAGTLGYLDPEYYRLHYLTTKSDIYSFGVLLLEIMSGRKAIDMGYPQGNIVEWAVPLIKAGLTRTILDNRIEDPPDLDALDKLAKVAAQCVRMRGKDRPSMEKVTTSLERALALMLGTPNSDGQLILPTEVVLGSARLNKKTSSRRSSSHKSESRKSDSEFGEPVRERDKDFVDVPAFGKLRGYHLSVEDLPRVSSLTRVQSFNKVHSLTRNQSLTRAYSFNKAYSQRTASSRLDEEDLEMQSFGSPPFETNNSLRAVDREAPRDIRIDSWPQHIRGPSSSVPCDSEISPESPRQLNALFMQLAMASFVMLSVVWKLMFGEKRFSKLGGAEFVIPADFNVLKETTSKWNNLEKAAPTSRNPESNSLLLRLACLGGCSLADAILYAENSDGFYGHAGLSSALICFALLPNALHAVDELAQSS